MRHSAGYLAFDAIGKLVLVFIALTTIIPVVLVISTSFSSEISVVKHGVTLIPRELSLEAYREIFSGSKTINAFKSSLFVTAVGTVLSVFLTALTAYPLSKRYLPYRRAISFFIYFTVLFNGGLIPFFLIVRATGLINSLWSLIIPLAIWPWNVFILRNFIMGLPEELEESARIDGANELTILVRILLPLLLPSLATMAMFYGVGKWNEWLYALIFISDKAKWPLPLLLREVIMIGASPQLQEAAMSQGKLPPAETIKMAIVVVSTVPIMLVYPFLQRYFASGLIAGAVKG